MQGVPAGWPPSPYPRAAPPLHPYAVAGGPEQDSVLYGGAPPPPTPPEPAYAPAAYAPETTETPHKGDIDNDSQWLGITMCAGGIVLSTVLLGWLAIVNKREHQAIEHKIEGVDQRLLDYRQAHQLVHNVLQGQMAALQQQQLMASMSPRTRHAAALLANVPMHPTVYGAPAGYPAFVPPVAAPVVSVAPPMVLPQYVMPQAPPAGSMVLAPTNPATPVIPPTRSFALPRHLEHAVASIVPTRPGV